MLQVQDGGAAQAAPVARLSVAEVETVLLPTPETFEARVGAAVAGEGACDPLGMEVEGGPQDQFWAPSPSTQGVAHIHLTGLTQRLQPVLPLLTFEGGVWWLRPSFFTINDEPEPDVFQAVRANRERERNLPLDPGVELLPWQQLWLDDLGTRVVGAAHRYPARWARIGTPAWQLEWLRSGQLWLPKQAAALLAEPSRPTRVKNDGELLWLKQQVYLWRRAGLINFVCGGKTSPIFLVDKPGEKLHRAVQDLTAVNAHMPVRSHRLSGLKGLLRLAKKGDWAIHFDLADAYFQFLLAFDSQRFCCFQPPWLKGLQFTQEDFEALRQTWPVPLEGSLEMMMAFVSPMFGGSTVPFTFNKGVLPFLSFVRFLLVRLWGFFDDFVALNQDKDKLRAIGRLTLRPLLSWLNLVVAESKSDWEPSQKIIKMGFEIDFKNAILTVTDTKADLVADQCQLLAAALVSQTDRTPGTRWLAAVSGRVMALDMAFVPGRLLCWTSFRLISHMVNSVGWNGRLDRPLAPSHPLVQDLLQVAEYLQNRQFTSTSYKRLLPLIIVVTDASDNGWGGVLHLGTFRYYARGTWTPAEKLLHINVKEIKGVTRSVVSFAEQGLIKNADVQPGTDSTVTKAGISKWGSRSADCQKAVRELWAAMLPYGIRIVSPYWLSTHENVVPDWLSRGESDPNDWFLDQAVFNQIVAIWGPPNMDRFADRTNSKCEKFNGLFYEQGAYAVNALAQHDFNDFFNYACPPVALLDRFVPMLVQQQGEAILIVPFWPAATWWLILAADHRIVDMIRLADLDPAGQQGLRTSRSGLLPGNAQRWEWVAIRVSFVPAPFHQH